MRANVKSPVSSLYGDARAQLISLISPPKEYKQTEGTETIDRVSLVSFVEGTSKLKMEPWQVHLCGILQSLTHTKGRRILIHKPPQHGGSVIVSQRLPAYLIGDNPLARVRVACYNIEQATRFTSINKDIMLSGEYAEFFPERELLHVSNRARADKFSTKARRDARDAQYSIVALGLETGFVGNGADTLIIDDPYASPQAAKSPAILKSTWSFWAESAKVRIDEDTNVVVMFHRYHQEDFVGQLIAEEGLASKGGQWELYSYRAEWDGDVRLEVGGPDPIGRERGEYLSPRKAKQPDYYRKQKSNPPVWLSQFQGKPSRADGSMIKTSRIRIIRRLPVSLTKVALAWDVASTEDGGDWTVGVVMGLGTDENVYVLHVERFRRDTGERDRIMRRCANRWRAIYPEIVIVAPQDPAAGGKSQAKSFQKLFKGHNVKIVLASNRGNKETKADPWSSYINSGLVCIVYDGDPDLRNPDGEYISWVNEFLYEHKQFPTQKVDDQVDAASDAFDEIALDIDIPPGESFDTMGFDSDDNRKLKTFKTLVPIEDEESPESLYRDSLIDNLEENYYDEELNNNGPSSEVYYTKNIQQYPTRSERETAKSLTTGRW